MSTVIYVAIVEGDQDAGYSAYFPDLPGCVTGAESMMELAEAAREALKLHLNGMAEDGELFPEPTALEAVKVPREVKEIGRLLVDIDIDDAPVRVNISIGAQFLKRVDIAAEARGMTRSGYLIEGARQMMAEKPNQFGAQYMIVPCDDSGLVVIWDRHSEQVVDVLSTNHKDDCNANFTASPSNSRDCHIHWKKEASLSALDTRPTVYKQWTHHPRPR